MSKNINTCDFVGMKKNKGKSNGFKSLVQEVKRKQKAEEIVKAIQKIQNQPNQKEQKQAKQKHFKIYSNSDRNIKEDLECYEQANEDAFDEMVLQNFEEKYGYYPQKRFSGEEHEECQEWSRRNEEQKFDFEHSSVDWSDDYCENSSDDDCIEELEPIVPKQLEFESRIYDLEIKLSAAQETIYQLLGGLFNQETQKQSLDNHMKFLYTGSALTDEEIEESRWPTTRQGDANEARIQQLEENIDVLVKRLKQGKPLHRFYRKFQKK